jgi:alpha-beta hydrolase superfamily lysophospholipase
MPSLTPSPSDPADAAPGPQTPGAPAHHSFTDPEGVVVQYYVWEAEHPRAVLQVAHGLGEYALRYSALAEEFAASGISVYADDHRGHGQTGLGQFGGDHSQLGHLGKGGLRAAVADLHQLTRIIRAENPELPIALLGHSWGSLMGQRLINDFASDFAAVVLTGTAYRMPGSMNGGDLNAKHKHLGTTGFEWLSRDPAVADEFAADPLTFVADVLKLFGVADGLRLFGRPSKPMPADVPVLLMAGGDDSLGGEGSVRKLAESYVTRGRLTDVQVVVYASARHEIFHETNTAEVVADLRAWLDARLAAAPAP